MGLVCFVNLVDLVYLASVIQPNKRNKLNNGSLLLSQLFEGRIKAIHSTDDRFHTGRIG